MFRRFMMRRYAGRGAMGYRRRYYGGFSFAATLIVVCFLVVLVLYWQGYVNL